MPTTLTITDLDVSFGARTLFTGLNLTLTDGDVTAVVGPNGSGKSTLMRTIVDEVAAPQGAIRLAPPDTTIAWLPQEVPEPSESLLAYARRRTGVACADAELEAASAALSSGMPLSEDRYAAALERWLTLGAADLDERLPEVAARVGLDVEARRRLGSLSGGQAARASLVAVLLSQYDVLLLDEPTNNLDDRGLELMTDFVRAHDGPVLIASHDRSFLDAVATDVLELDLHQQQVRHYRGGWSDFVEQRKLGRTQAWEAYEEYAAMRDSLGAQAKQRQEWAVKGRSGPKATKDPDKYIREKHRARADRQAAKAARLDRAVGRLAVVDQPRKEWQLRYAISEGRPSAEVVATLAAAVVDRDGFRLGPVSVTVARGDRIAVVGDNGSGKTTLLAALLGRLPLTSGRQSLGARVEVGVLDQRRHLLESDESLLDVVRHALLTPNAVFGGESSGTPPLSPPNTAFEAVPAAVARTSNTAFGGVASGGWSVAEVRTLLAKFGLGAEHVHRSARSLSMGERTRALMALFQGREVNTLVLDEPTNHLDVAAIEQLEAAVAAFSGTVLVVSHDKRLLSGIGLSHRWQVANGHVTKETL